MTIWLPDLDGRRGPVYRSIVAALADDIRAGRLAPGDRLPPQRDLAWRLKVTVGTVSRAYAEAERLGLVSGEVGRGTFVRDPGRGEPSLAEFLGSQFEPGAETVIDMSVNRPLHGNAAEVAQALERLSRQPDFGLLLGYHIERAPLRYRSAGAAWLARDGVETSPEGVVVAASGQQAIIAALAAVSRPRDAILAEEFTYPGLKSAAGLIDRRILPLRIDEHGLCPDDLGRALAAGAGRVIYTINSAHNPATCSLPLERRRAVAELARRFDAMIIEDGVYRFLDPAPAPTIASLAPERTVYISTLTKSVCPALRIGFLAVPEGLAARVDAASAAATVMAPLILAEAAAMLIEDDTAGRCAERLRRDCAQRQAMARAILGSACHPGVESAFNLWLKLPPPWRAQDYVAEARRNGVAIAGGDAFAVGKASYEAVRVSLTGAGDEAALQRGLRVLAGLLKVEPDHHQTTV